MSIDAVTINNEVQNGLVTAINRHLLEQEIQFLKKKEKMYYVTKSEATVLTGGVKGISYKSITGRASHLCGERTHDQPENVKKNVFDFVNQERMAKD